MIFNYVEEVYYKNRLLFTWGNITNQSYLARHMLWIISNLLGTLLIGKLYYVSGFIQAIKKIGLVLERRKRERQLSKREDIQILCIDDSEENHLW